MLLFTAPKAPKRIESSSEEDDEDDEDKPINAVMNKMAADRKKAQASKPAATSDSKPSACHHIISVMKFVQT